jgi:hypothetical protein
MNDTALRSAGILAPLTGRPSHLPEYPNFGNHNIAWELNDDPRFRPESGTLNELLSEIARAASHVVVLSSEDFEYLHAKPTALRELARALRDIGYEIEFITYLRPQGEYAQSLYLSLLLFGLDLSFSDFLDIILERGAFTFSDRWIFQFDYTKLLDALADAAGPGGMSVRRYRQTAAASRLLAEFASIVQAPSGKAAFDQFDLPRRMNRRMSLETASELLLDNQDPSHHREREAAPPGSFWKAEDGARLLARFSADNDDLANKYGLRLPVLGSAFSAESDPLASFFPPVYGSPVNGLQRLENRVSVPIVLDRLRARTNRAVIVNDAIPSGTQFRVE